MTERNQAWNSLMHYTHHTFLLEELLSGLFFIIPFTNLMAIRIVAEKGFFCGGDARGEAFLCFLFNSLCLSNQNNAQYFIIFSNI